MPFIIIFILYFSSNYYLFTKLNKLIKTITDKKHKKVYSVILLIIIMLIAIFAIVIYAVGIKNTFLKTLSNIWIGIFVYSLIIFLISDLISTILKLTKLYKKIFTRRNNIIFGVFQMILILTIIVYGSINANNYKVQTYNLNINKEANTKTLKIALLSDLHIGGSITPKYLEKVVSDINNNNVDLVLIAGDILDNSLSSVSNINEFINVLKKLKSKYGTYGILGNHDTFTNNIEENVNLFESMNINVLENELVIINNEINLIGKNSDRLDNDENKVINLLSNIDTLKPTILMIHEPTNIKEYFDKNIDLIVAGHTHNGQIFPGNLIVKAIYYNAHGLKTENNTNTLVSSGINLWGPNLRIGTNNELIYINMNIN